MEYTVSVRLMTYNHELFIREAMDSIFMQDVQFPIEVVVGDDFSEDETLNIIQKYKSTSNINIKLLNRRKGDEYWKKRQRHGRLYNFLNILNNCEGKYIALIDGDDYWTDKLKLQKQVEYMENNPSCSMCFHNADYKYEDKSEENYIYRPKRKKGQSYFKTSNVLKYGGALAPSSSIMLSQTYIGGMPDWFTKAPVGDFPLLLYYSLKGDLGYIDESMSVYRLKAEGSWSKDRTYSNKIDNLDGLNKMLIDFSKTTSDHYGTISLAIVKNICRKVLIMVKYSFIKLKHVFFG